MKKRILILSLIFVFALALPFKASALVDKSSSFYVADYANVLSDTTKQMIINTNASLEKMTGGQIVVVTVEYLDGLKADEYAVRLMNQWGVGDAKKNNGMLLLLATQENKAWLTQGAGITGSFTDSRINGLFEKYFWKDFDKGNYDTAVNSMFKQMVLWYEGYYHVNILSGSSGSSNSSVVTSSGGSYTMNNYATTVSLSSLIWLFIKIALVLFILFRILSPWGVGKRFYGPRPYVPFVPFMFMGMRGPRYRDRNDRWRGGGGIGGGGGFGGHSGGGGGGGFSGGGGGFGGGGGGHSGGGGGGRA